MGAGLAVVLTATAGCDEPVRLNAAPCYERYTAIELEYETESGIAPADAIGRYAAVFQDQDGTQRTVDVRLRRARTGWVRDVVREPTFGYVETPACDVRVGVELEMELETGDQWFAESFDAVAVRSTLQDAWLVRTLKPVDRLGGTWKDERETIPCADVDIGFSLWLEGSTSGGRIVERLPGIPEAEDACFKEILQWDLPVPE